MGRKCICRVSDTSVLHHAFPMETLVRMPPDSLPCRSSLKLESVQGCVGNTDSRYYRVTHWRVGERAGCSPSRQTLEIVSAPDQAALRHSVIFIKSLKSTAACSLPAPISLAASACLFLGPLHQPPRFYKSSPLIAVHKENVTLPHITRLYLAQTIMLRPYHRHSNIELDIHASDGIHVLVVITLQVYVADVVLRRARWSRARGCLTWDRDARAASGFP